VCRANRSRWISRPRATVAACDWPELKTGAGRTGGRLGDEATGPSCAWRNALQRQARRRVSAKLEDTGDAMVGSDERTVSARRALVVGDVSGGLITQASRVLGGGGPGGPGQRRTLRHSPVNRRSTGQRLCRTHPAPDQTQLDQRTAIERGSSIAICLSRAPRELCRQRCHGVLSPRGTAHLQRLR